MIDHTAKNGHSVISISENESAYLEELNVSHKALTQSSRNLRLIESEIEMLIAAKESAIQDMEKFIKLAHEQLDQRRTDLKNQILDQFDKQQNTLLDKTKGIQENILMLKKNIINANNLIQTGNLTGLNPISEHLYNINEETRSLSSSLDLGENYMAFDSNKGLEEFNNCLCTLGQVYTKGFLPTVIAFRGTDGKASHKSRLMTEVCDHQGDTVPLSSDTLSVHITDPLDTKLDTHLSTVGSKCTVTFTPQISGLHKISGMFLGHELISEQTHISVSSNNPVLKFGDYGSGDGTCDIPWAIATDNRNNCLYVTDVEKGLVQKFTGDGEFLSGFSLFAHGQEQTTCNIGLDLNKGLIFCTANKLKGGVFVEAGRILVFDLEGEIEYTFRLKAPWGPRHIGIDGHGDLIMSCPYKGYLVKVDQQGTFLMRMGHDIMTTPGHIAINQDNSIIVPDEDNDCIYIFNPDGTVRHKFGSSGTGKGQLKRPRGVASDGEYILVSETENNRVQVFSNDGTFVSMIDSAADPLNEPCGLAVTTNGYVYVADYHNNCIKMYKYREIAS